MLTLVGAWLSPPGGPLAHGIANRVCRSDRHLGERRARRGDTVSVGRALDQSMKDLADTKFALDQAAIVATTDVTGRINYVNDKFCEISKYSPRGAARTGSPDHQLRLPLRRSSSATLADDRATARIWRGEIRNRAKDGSFYWVDTTIVPFLDERGKPYQYMAIRYDITERKRSETLLREQAALARLGEMAAVVAHEVKNPLAGHPRRACR